MTISANFPFRFSATHPLVQTRTLNTEPLEKELQIRAVHKIFKSSSFITGGIINGKRVRLIGIPESRDVFHIPGADWHPGILGLGVRSKVKTPLSPSLVDADHLDLRNQPHHDRSLRPPNNRSSHFVKGSCPAAAGQTRDNNSRASRPPKTKALNWTTTKKRLYKMSKYAIEPGSIARSLTMEARAIVAIPVTEKTHTQDHCLLLDKSKWNPMFLNALLHYRSCCRSLQRLSEAEMLPIRAYQETTCFIVYKSTWTAIEWMPHASLSLKAEVKVQGLQVAPKTWFQQNVL